MKKIFVLAVTLLLGFVLVACGGKKSEVEKIIEQAETMTLDELIAKAYEESNGMTLYGLGNSSRGKTAGETFVEKVKATYQDYTGKIEWSQPKENSIFETVIFINFKPKKIREAAGVDVEANGKPLSLQTISKVFMFNHGNGQYNFSNVWHFVKENERPMFMGLNSEPIGFNFLLMLTREDYVKIVKEAFDALSDTDKAYFQPKVNALKAKATELKLPTNAEYSLAW